MAIATFSQILNISSPKIDDIMKKYALSNIERKIITEETFKGHMANLLINACGEATMMLSKLNSDVNSNADCILLSTQIWKSLLAFINTAANIEHILLILENISQLLKINYAVRIMTSTKYFSHHKFIIKIGNICFSFRRRAI